MSILTVTVQGSQKEKGEVQGTENIFGDLIAESFPNLGKETDILVQKPQRVPNRINSKRTIPRYTVIKIAKIKENDKNSKKKKKSNKLCLRNLHSQVMKIKTKLNK